MDERETRAMMEDVAAVMKSLVTNAVTPIVSRLDALEKRLADLPVPKDGKDGKDADIEEIAALAAASLLPDIMEVRSMVEAIPAPLPPPELPDIPAMIADAIEAAKPEPVDFKAMVAEAVAVLPPAEKGKDADPAEVAALVTQEAERILAGWERPQDGKSVTLDQLSPYIEESVARAVSAIPTPKDGIDGKDGRNGLDAVKFFRDDKGHLIVVKSDGSTDDLGEYVGKDGAAGLNGKDGLDGVGFDDMSLVFDEEGIMIKFVKGENVKQERLPVPFYRGVFKEGQTYHAGNCVSYGGSTWIAHVETADKPDGTTKTWQLSTKRGRDGRDGIMKDPPKGGPVKVG